MTGQSAMFGNVSNFAETIGPGGRSASFASAPAMYDPAAFTMPPPMYDVYGQNLGPRMLGAGASIAQSALPMAALAGSFLPGPAGKAFSMMDPSYAAMSGFFRGSGLLSGVSSGGGLMGTAEGVLGNAGRIATGGFGNIARAGISGLGAGMASFLPAYAATQAISYGAGQMMEGAHHTQHVQDFLQRSMRFSNPTSRTGFGFNREEGAQIASTIRDVAGKDMLTNTRELTSIMEQGVQGGLFKAVQDAETFKKKFKELTSTLKVVARTMNTTLEGALPFLTEARKMGFWTPTDVMAAGTITRSAASATGMSVAETQATMGQGAAMARSIGANGMTGALGMQRSLGMVGGGLRSGFISEQSIQEATGLQGPEAVREFSTTLQAGATRFAGSRQARWLLASMANKNYTGLDKGKLGAFMSGGLSVGDISRTAEHNVQGHGNAAKFLMGEEEMRGDLVAQGPMAQTAFIRGALGDKLQGSSDMDKYVTRRMIQRFMNVNARTADIYAELARNQPRILRENAERDLATKEAELRQQDIMINHSFGGAMRQLGHGMDTWIGRPLQEAGSSISQSVSRAYEDLGDRVWGRKPEGSEISGITDAASAKIRRSVMGMGDKWGSRALGATPTASMEQLQENYKTSSGNLASLLGSSGGIGRAAVTAALAPFGAVGAAAAHALTTGGTASDHASAFISMQTNPKFAEALDAFHAGHEGAGKTLLAQLSDDPSLNDRQKKAVTETLNQLEKGGDGAKKVAGALKEMAGGIAGMQTKAYANTIKTRMEAAREQLGGGLSSKVMAINALKGASGVGSTVQQLIEGNYGAKERQPLMEKLASQAGAMDANQAGKLLEMLPDTAEFAGIRGAIGMGMQGGAAGRTKSWSGDKGAARLAGLINTIRGTGGGGRAEFTKEMLAKVQKGGAGAQEVLGTLTAGLSDPASKGQITDLVKELGGSHASAGVKKAYERSAALAGLGAEGREKAKGLGDAELAGQLGGRGSMTGIHDTLTRMLGLQESYFKAENGAFKAPYEKPPENSSHV